MARDDAPTAAELLSRQSRCARRITVLGSTGSIGVSTLDLVEFATARNDADLTIEALTANRNLALVVEQAKKFRPRFVALADESLGGELKSALAGEGIETGAGPSAIIEAAARDADWVMAAIVGAAGLMPTLRAAERGAAVALANKECLVCAGDVVSRAVRAAGGMLLPVDSEHNAIFQVYDFQRPNRISRLILTASGGPFRTWSKEQMAVATPAQAVAHPNWSMGAKISVDSATMMNKGLELIEAAHLFPTPHDRIEMLVHPQSVIHSMVEYVDGSVLAQLGTPDMRTPIASCLAWPDRIESPSAKLNFAEVATLTFEAPDPERFPAIRLAREAVAKGGAYPAMLNAANEVAVAEFLSDRLDFNGIPYVVEATLEAADRLNAPHSLGSLAEALEADAAARRLAEAAVAARAA
ncbi:MAG: 1-deoxy-D-xylulose-5-phosphate reductoisomerase [Alphaproteobacteria bacterium]|nr:1-deoxy-D-xylulose-5-phosphate reductoisomerase [Alphaproteobacteria bacterium]